MENGSGSANRSESESRRTELIDVQTVADLLSCSTRTVYRLADAGKMPQPLRLGKLVRWRHKDMSAWLDAGCPPKWKTNARGDCD